jgi:hypothetical protein
VKKKYIILLILLLAIVLIAVFSGRNYSTLKQQESNFSVKDTSSITKIFMADNNVNEVVLKRTPHGWVLNNKYPANGKAVDLLLETIRKIKVKAPVSRAEHNNVVKRMAGFAVKVEIYQKVPRINLFNKIRLFYHEKKTRVFYVGDVTQNNLGTYMLMEGARHPYVVYIPGFRGFVSIRFSPKPDDWKSHVVFNQKLGDIKLVTLVDGEKPEQSFKVVVKNAMGDYDIIRLSDNSKVREYDTLRLLNFLTSFRDLKYEALLNKDFTPQEIDSITHSKPIYVLTLVTDKKDTVKVTMFKKPRFPDEVVNAVEELVPVDLDRMYGLINKDKDFVLLQYYVFDKVLHPLDYYVKKDEAGKKQ